MSTKWSLLRLLAMVIMLIDLTQSFQPLSILNGKSTSHREITIRAILRKTAEVCRDIAAAAGQEFSLTIDDSLTAERVHKECSSSTSSSILSSIFFSASIVSIYLNNANVDLAYALSGEHHFDNEAFQEGRDLITQGMSAVKASIKQANFIAGRKTLGQLCHTLQDFYSHSNWVELGNTDPYNALIKPDQPFENLAGPNDPTCRNCAGENCDNNLLPNVLKKRLLTSGYFSVFFSKKPKGKCSHGGFLDQTSKQEPVGGINKDDIGSSHGSRHSQAANLAVTATMDLLEDIRLAVGDENFLRLMGLSQFSVLSFVIDTTGNTRDGLAQAKTLALNIIDSRRGTLQEPPAYTLVAFNDPGFGPLIATANADKFKEKINALIADGGGDNPELSLSRLQLALTAAPPSSEIFVFTNTLAKDAHLKNTISALIETTKSVVTFLLTDVLPHKRKRSLRDVLPRVLSQTDAQLYHDLAQASGGQAIKVSRSDFALATSVIKDSSASTTVIVFQGVRNPGRPALFMFDVDGSLTNKTIYVTGTSSLDFNLISPTGVSQSSSELSGPLASLSMVGNLRRLSLNNDTETGLWRMSVDSNDPYSVKVTGQSPVNFIYNLVETNKGLHADVFLKEGRPLAGENATLLVTVTGSDSIHVTEVTLCDSSSPTEVNGTLQAQANSTNVEAGSTTSIRFNVTTASGIGAFMVRVTNDRGYNPTSPNSVTLETHSGGNANGIVTLTAPDGAASGTEVTLKIEVEDAAATDINYVVLRFSVTDKVREKQ
ncbi:von Willebrand factor A domain-containing protein 7-like isoform 2-T2 [Syngnathus typhle]